jgi:SAM-dependent methyltransferase
VPAVTPAPPAVAHERSGPRPAEPPAAEPSAPEIEPEASWPSHDDPPAPQASFEPIVPMRIITVASDLPAVESTRLPQQPAEEHAPPHPRSEATTIRITRDGEGEAASPFPSHLVSAHASPGAEHAPSTTRAGQAPEHAPPQPWAAPGAPPAAEAAQGSTPEPARVAPAAPDTLPSSEPGEEAFAPAQAQRAELDDAELVEEVEPERMSLPVAAEGEVLLDFDDDQPKASAPRKPPPPPPSSRKPAPQSAERPQAQRPQERPWWEELFGEDFLRTMDTVPDRHVLREVDFIEASLGVESGGMLLDLACGEGRHAVELTARGYGVVGVDYSSAMLTRAAENARARGVKPTFAQGDMRELAFEEAFDGVYSWDTSFGYFDDETNAAILRSIHRALRPGGVLLLDVVNREYVASRQPSLVWFEGEGCVCMDDMCVDFLTSRLRVKRTVMFDPAAALVMHDSPSTRRPACRAAMTSSTVLMPTASPPSARSMRTSAGVSYCGPSTPA